MCDPVFPNITPCCAVVTWQEGRDRKRDITFSCLQFAPWGRRAPLTKEGTQSAPAHFGSNTQAFLQVESDEGEFHVVS